MKFNETLYWRGELHLLKRDWGLANRERERERKNYFGVYNDNNTGIAHKYCVGSWHCTSHTRCAHPLLHINVSCTLVYHLHYTSRHRRALLVYAPGGKKVGSPCHYYTAANNLKARRNNMEKVKHPNSSGVRICIRVQTTRIYHFSALSPKSTQPKPLCLGCRQRPSVYIVYLYGIVKRLKHLLFCDWCLHITWTDSVRWWIYNDSSHWSKSSNPLKPMILHFIFNLIG